MLSDSPHLSNLTQNPQLLMQKTQKPEHSRLKTGGEGDNRGQDGWIASPTHGW